MNIMKLPNTRVTIDGTCFLILSLIFSESRSELYIDAGVRAATLNTQTFNRLKHLQMSKPLVFEGVLSTQALEDLTDTSGIIKAGTVTNISVNLYGRSEDSDEIALGLSRNELFLQDPESMLEGACYQNPQYLRLPAHALVCEDEAWSPVPKALYQVGKQETSIEDTHYQVSLGTDFETHLDFDLLLNQFAQHDYLTQVPVDPRIRTPLLELVTSFVSSGIGSLTRVAIRKRGSIFCCRENLSLHPSLAYSGSCRTVILHNKCK